MTNTTPTPGTTSPSSTAAKTTPSHSSGEAGKTEINDAVVAKVAGIAARDVRGVHALGGAAGRALGAIRERVGGTNAAQGISVEVGDTQVAVDVTLTAEYPVALQEVAEDVRSAIANAIESIVGMEVAEINVTVADVYIPSDDDDNTESRVN